MATMTSRLAPPLALMVLIFVLSAQPDLSTGLGGWDTVLRKAAHMTVYGLLWLAWWRALGYGSPWPAVVLTLLYAISDEWHQTFVEGRSGRPLDVGIDAAGVAVAMLAVRWAQRRGRGRAPRRATASRARSR
jgi:VanZ family protein